MPPVMIIVCDNTDVAEVFFRKISGGPTEEVTTRQEVDEVLADEEGDDEPQPSRRAAKKSKARTMPGGSELWTEFANTPNRKHMIRIDSKLLAEAES